MDHAYAIESKAAARYVLGELDEQEQSDYEAHSFDCSECHGHLVAMMAFREGATALLAKNPPPQPVLVPATPRRRRVLWQLLAAYAAGLTGLAVYQNAVQVPGLREELAWSLYVPSYPLPEARRGPAASPADDPASTPIRIPQGARQIELRLSKRSLKPYPYYDCVVRRGDGGLVGAQVMPSHEGEPLRVNLPTSRVPPGRYEIVLSGIDAPPGPVVAPDLARYVFTIE
jgi:hypothetical protein